MVQPQQTGPLGGFERLASRWAGAWSGWPGILFGFRLWASVILALLVAYWLQLDNAYWAATSASIVAQPGLGASLRKGRFRAIGTVLGGVVIVLLIAIFEQSRLGLLLSLTLWCAICSYFATILPNFAGYAAALAGYTVAVVFADIIDNPANVFPVAVSRTAEIGIGIFAAGVVHTLTDFGDARSRLARAMADVGRGIAAGVVRTLAAGQETLPMRTSRRELIRGVIALEGTIDEAVGEPTHLRYRPQGLQAAVEGYFSALSAWRGIANRLNVMTPPPAATQGAALPPPVSRIAGRDWLDDPEGVREICDTEGRRVLKTSAADLPAELMVDGVVGVFRGLERAANGLVLVTSPGRERPDRSDKRHYVPDVLPPVVSALRAVIALTVAELFWVATAWPAGPQMITFTAITVILFSRLADNAFPSAVEFGSGLALAAALAVIVKLAILPGVHGGFLSLSLLLACVLVPLGVLAAGTWRRTMFVSLATNLLPILTIENETNYDATRLFNSALAISAGTMVGAIFIQLLPPPTPATRIRRLLALTLRDVRRLVGGRRRFSRAAWIGLVSRRLAAMPAQATLDEVAHLLASLSVGEAALTLLEGRPHLAAGGAELDHGFAALAHADVAASRQWFTRFCDLHPATATEMAQRGRHTAVQSAVQAALIAEALKLHSDFFSSRR